MSVDGDLKRLASLVRQLQGALGGHALREGSSSATWTAAYESASVTIAHGLGATPVWVGFTTRTTVIGYALVSKDATNIVVKGFYTPGTALTGTFNFDWSVRG